MRSAGFKEPINNIIAHAGADYQSESELFRAILQNLPAQTSVSSFTERANTGCRSFSARFGTYYDPRARAQRNIQRFRQRCF